MCAELQGWMLNCLLIMCWSTRLVDGAALWPPYGFLSISNFQNQVMEGPTSPSLGESSGTRTKFLCMDPCTWMQVSSFHWLLYRKMGVHKASYGTWNDFFVFGSTYTNVSTSGEQNITATIQNRCRAVMWSGTWARLVIYN